MSTPTRSKRSGFTLLEVLIALVVLSIGMFGVLSLQAKSLQYSYASYQRTLAGLHAKDLVERLWGSACMIPGSGNANANAIRDNWRTLHDGTTTNGLRSLPNWTGDLTISGTQPTRRYTVTITWTDERLGFTSTTDIASHQTFVYSTNIPTLPGCS